MVLRVAWCTPPSPVRRVGLAPGVGPAVLLRDLRVVLALARAVRRRPGTSGGQGGAAGDGSPRTRGGSSTDVLGSRLLTAPLAWPDVIEVSCETAATPGTVWDVLADGWRYPSWVVGAPRVRSVSSAWPAVGSELHHSVGAWPVLIDDRTTVTACEPGRRLVLRARLSAAGQIDVELLLRRTAAGGCVILMREDVATGPALLVPRPVRAALFWPRNVETLRRLCYLAERQSR